LNEAVIQKMIVANRAVSSGCSDVSELDGQQETINPPFIGEQMKRVLLAATILAAGWAFALTTAKADDILDPLHGMQCTAGTCTNTDNGSFAPLVGTDFGFTISGVQGGGGATGTFTLVIGVPTDQLSGFSLPSLSDNGVTLATQPTLFSSSNFYNSGSVGLAQFLGLGTGFSPTDNFSNLSQGISQADPGFSGNLELFTLTLTNFSLDANNPPQSLLNDFNFGSNLPAGTILTGLFVYPSGCTGTACNDVGTAASGHLVEQSSTVPGPIVGAGLPGLVTALFGMIGLNRFRKRRNLA
jgi:hypothetical protein